MPLLLLLQLTAATVRAQPAQPVPSAYPLDVYERVLPEGARFQCPKVPLTYYRGTTLHYSGALHVYPAFIAKLQAFEQLVAELSLRYYGRAPRRITHLGSYTCRPMRLYPSWISEHAFGNAFDMEGFDFGALGRNDALPPAAPRALRHAFSIRMQKHWSARDALGAYHSAFLRELAQRVIDRPEMFRVVLGPAYPGHKNHLHLDFASYRVVQVFD